MLVRGLVPHPVDADYNQTIQVIVLSGCGLADSSVEKILDAITGSTQRSVYYLDLSGNQLTEKTAIRMAEFLSDVETSGDLVHLNLSDNEKLGAGTTPLVDGLSRRLVAMNQPSFKNFRSDLFLMPLLSLNLAKVGMVDRMLEALTSKLLDGQRRAIAFSNFNKDQLMYDPMANFGSARSPVKVKFDVYEGGMNLDLSGNLFTIKSFARIGDFLDEIVGIKTLHLNDQYKDQELRFEKSRHKAASTKELLTEGATQDMVLSRHLFDFKYPFGRGGFGKVYRASNEKLKHDPIREFAIKEMEKARVIAKKGVEGVLNELKLHSGLSSNFIVKVHYAF